MSNIGKHGDSTTTGGLVIATLSNLFNHGVRLAIAGDKATCGNCKGAWDIMATGRRMTDHGRAVVLNWDWVLCPCKKNRVLAQAENMGYHHQHSEARATATAASLSTAAFALDTAETAPRAPAATPAAPVRNRESPTERRCTLRIGVFFDGTRNNAGNTELFTHCQASTGSALGQSQQEQAAIAEHCKRYMADDKSSYGGGYTNVWRLYKLYQDSREKPLDKDAREYFIPIYVEGIGTATGERDDVLAMGFGIGGTGILAKVEQTLSKAIPDELESFSRTNSGVSIAALELDVFGFSRGAAAARHFVNEINRKQQGLLAQKLSSSQAKLAEGFDVDGDVRIGFVGLFDTVVARANVADGFNVVSGHNGPVKVALPADCARKVVQLVARDEHRANFMLTTVAPEHREIALPGVHSDIGGGYRENHEGPLMLIKPLRTVEKPVELNGDLYMPFPGSTRACQLAETERQRWVTRLGNIDEGSLTVDGWVRMESQPPARGSVVNTRQPVAYATVCLNRAIDWRYQLIPLR
ncbi:PAAR domain-containing protein, partial [Dyella flava]